MLVLFDASPWAVMLLRDAMNVHDFDKWWRARGEAELRALLMAEWDPIGVSEWPEAYDEYDHYTGPVARLLFEGAQTRMIADYLRHIEVEYMGFDEDRASTEELLRVAAVAEFWYAASTRTRF